MRYARLIFFTVLFISSLRLWPQYGFRNFFNLSGKKNVPFKCISADKNGILWLGTQDGLISFDGKKTEDHKKQFNYATIRSSAVLADTNGYVWLGTENGKLYHLKPEKQADSLSLGKEPPSSKITSLFRTSSGKLYIGTYGDGIYIAEKNAVTHLTTSNGLSDNVVYSLLYFEGKLWCGTDAGVSILSNIEEYPVCEILSQKNGLPDNIVRNLSADKNKLLICMQDSGICRLDPVSKKFERMPLFSNWSYGAIINAFAEGNELVIACERNGLVYSQNNKLHILPYTDNILSGGANAFIKDPAGNFWLASSQGLHMVFPKTYSLISEGLSGHKITGLAIDNQKTIWAAHEKGIQKIIRDTYGDLNFVSVPGIDGITVTCITPAPDGTLWFGTYGSGIFITDTRSEKKLKLNSANGGLPNDNIASIRFEKDGKVYITTLGGGLITGYVNADGNLEKRQLFTEKNGLGSNYVYSTASGPNGELFVGSDGGGLELFKNNSFTSLTTKFGYRSNSVFSLCSDRKGNIWAVTNDEGILKYDGVSLKAIGIREGLRNLQPEQLIAIGEFIYAIHSGGIDKININAHSITYMDLPDTDLEPSLNAVCIDEHSIYAGTNKGILICSYTTVGTNTSKPVSMITALQVNYRSVPTDSLHEFAYWQNNLSIGFDGIWLKEPLKLNYRYKLIGYDDKWIDSPENKLVSYNNLGAGNYTFVVQVKNPEDVWSDESRYTFTILAPLWKKWWFWVMVAGAIASLIFVFIKYRLRTLKKENLVLEAKVKQRTSEIEKQSKIIEEKSKELELLSLVASETDNVVLILDADGRVEYVNESFHRVNHLTLEELKQKGETIYEISNNPDIKKAIEEAVTHRRSVKYEALNTKENNEIWEASTLTPIFNERDELKKIIIIDSDITESKKQEKIILQKNKDITDSIEYARKIQTAILPSEEKIKRYLPHSFILYKTKDIVSGDFYWFAETADCSVIAAVDCTGHGVPGAFMSLIGYNILNRIVNENGITDPGAILRFLNTGVIDVLDKNRNSSSVDGMDIAICKIKHNSNEIEYAGAMRPLVIVGDHGIREIKPTKLSIGTKPEDNQPILYTTHSAKIEKNEMAYIFTDGYSDQFGGEKGKKLSTTRFKELLQKYHSMDPEKQHELLLKFHYDWKGSHDQIDDILVIGFRPGN